VLSLKLQLALLLNNSHFITSDFTKRQP